MTGFRSGLVLPAGRPCLAVGPGAVDVAVLWPGSLCLAGRCAGVAHPLPECDLAERRAKAGQITRELCAGEPTAGRFAISGAAACGADLARLTRPGAVRVISGAGCSQTIAGKPPGASPRPIHIQVGRTLTAFA